MGPPSTANKDLCRGQWGEQVSFLGVFRRKCYSALDCQSGLMSRAMGRMGVFAYLAWRKEEFAGAVDCTWGFLEAQFTTPRRYAMTSRRQCGGRWFLVFGLGDWVRYARCKVLKA